MLTSQIDNQVSIVFVHLGTSWPEHLAHAITQARSFNASAPIVVLAAAVHGPKLASFDVEHVPCEDLPLGKEHRRFLKSATIDRKFRQGFWQFAIERFFFLADYMKFSGVSQLLHLESDNLIYFEVKALRSVFEATFPGLGVVKDTDERAIPGVVWVSDYEALGGFLKFYNRTLARKGVNDMDALGQYTRDLPYYLPVVPAQYVLSKGFILRSTAKSPAEEPVKFCALEELFHGVFDGAALGQFLGGIDGRNEDVPGTASVRPYINETAVYQVSDWSVRWHEDEQGRNVPFYTYQGKTGRILSLHVHSKKLVPFLSTSLDGRAREC